MQVAYGVRLDASQAWVIGDTPRDLECARAAGARCLLVGTGRYRSEELAALGADAVLDDLSDTARVVEILTGELDGGPAALQGPSVPSAAVTTPKL